MSAKNSNKKLYAIIYPFMASELGLSGLMKEVFAVIFCFWLSAGGKPVKASYSVIQTITGAARGTVMKSISGLIERRFIQAEKRKGKTTLYQVTINQKILATFSILYNRRIGSLCEPLVVQDNNQTGSIDRPQKYKKQVYKGTGTSLKVKPREDIDFGDLPEAK